jgi:hypothetical protein
MPLLALLTLASALHDNPAPALQSLGFSRVLGGLYPAPSALVILYSKLG